MQTRREFLGRSAAGLIALGFSSTAHADAAPASALGVQLYTVRKDIQTSPQSVLAAIRKIGYRSVETFSAQYNTLSAKELRTLITDAGLAVPSAHFSYDDFGSRFDYAKELGVEYVVCGAESKSVSGSLDGFKRAADQYNIWGEQAKKLGFKFAFHNHDFEFQSFNGVTGFDTLMQNTDPQLVQWQIDCYWVTQAAMDPAALIRRYQSRIQTLHVKDRKPGFETSTVTGPSAQHFTEVGTGTIDWKAVWSAAQAAKVPYLFVEQDTTEIPPLESLQISYTNMKRLFV